MPSPSQPSTATGASAEGAVIVEPTKEVRLAIVLYGGVSLAIYINGVAQELFHLVRATAGTAPPGAGSSPALLSEEQLTGSEAVYREVARILPLAEQDQTKWSPDRQPSGPRIQTRFVIDILSGTSAGGINGVFLAKALANRQEMGQLENLWMEEGDISKLLNDSRSRVKGLTQETPPASLLNSPRMYWKLLKAFEDMEPGDARSTEDTRSPYVQELDLYVTTTDLRGLKLPLHLSGEVAVERRYRNVFHFAYGSGLENEDRNDFHAGNNPILAFAARCTSAFPFAFQPMLFGDLREALRLSEHFRDKEVGDHPWKSFYTDYFPDPDDTGQADSAGTGWRDLTPEQDLPFVSRPFADGGALDNKPFSWATRTLLRRKADVVVDRKLIFIEPDPGHPELEATPQGRPDVIKNFELQGFSLPRQETIRDDLDAVMERNRVIERIRGTLRGVEQDLAKGPPEDTEREAKTAAEKDAIPWADQDLSPSIDAWGRAYAGYQRLKVSTVTDDLAHLVASVAGLDEDSDDVVAVRYLVQAWRDATFTYYRSPDTPPTKQTFNRFLFDFDYTHRLRRLQFLRRKVDELFGVGSALQAMLQIDARAAEAAQQDPEGFRSQLLAMKGSLADVFVKLRYLGRRLRRPIPEPLGNLIGPTGINRDRLKAILASPVEADRAMNAVTYFNDAKEAFDEFAEALAKTLRDGVTDANDPKAPPAYGLKRAGDDLRSVLSPQPGHGPAERAAQRFVRHYLDHFDDYDMVAFPMLYGSDAGETDTVEIIRIAPEDATNIIDERGTNFEKRQVRGFKYFHFGGFLDASWRENDILFGRLNAAECLIKAMLPVTPDSQDVNDVKRTAIRGRLIDEAQAAIIKELPASRLQKIFGGDPPSDATDVVKAFGRHSIPETLPASSSIPIMSRGSNVVGKMLKGIAGDKGPFKPVGWFARGASLFAGLVTVATPGGAPSAVFFHLAPLLLAFEAILLVLGLVFRSPAVTHTAVLALVVTGSVWAVVALLASVMRGRQWWKNLLKLAGVLAIILVVLLVLGEIGHASFHWTQYWSDLKAFFHLGNH